jgi:aldos-2-ulose dehydratase
MYAKAFLKPQCQPDQPATLPLFQPQLVQGGRPDGYWVEAFPFHSRDTRLPNIIGYGLGTDKLKGDILMFTNPYRDASDQ